MQRASSRRRYFQLAERVGRAAPAARKGRQVVAARGVLERHRESLYPSPPSHPPSPALEQRNGAEGCSLKRHRIEVAFRPPPLPCAARSHAAAAGQPAAKRRPPGHVLRLAASETRRWRASCLRSFRRLPRPPGVASATPFVCCCRPAPTPTYRRRLKGSGAAWCTRWRLKVSVCRQSVLVHAAPRWRAQQHHARARRAKSSPPDKAQPF